MSLSENRAIVFPKSTAFVKPSQPHTSVRLSPAGPN